MKDNNISEDRSNFVEQLVEEALKVNWKEGGYRKGIEQIVNDTVIKVCDEIEKEVSLKQDEIGGFPYISHYSESILSIKTQAKELKNGTKRM